MVPISERIDPGQAPVSRRETPPLEDTMIIGIVAVIWVGLVIVFLIGWSRFHARARWLDGIDEQLYVNGKDPASIREAAWTTSLNSVFPRRSGGRQQPA
jgi:hypothetical protein